MSACALTVRWAAASDVGRLRARNEDALRIVFAPPCAVLADGMGGHRGGDVAARLAVDVVAEHLAVAAGSADEEVCVLLGEAVAAANKVIFEHAQIDPGLAGMGATVVAVRLFGERMCCAHVGDSRLYLFRGGELELLTRDHTMLQELVDAGMITAEQARAAPFRGMLTRALGALPELDADVFCRPVHAGDVLLLCSDGLTDMLGDDEIAAVLSGGGDVDEWAAELVAFANARGGRDNITVVLAQAS